MVADSLIPLGLASEHTTIVLAGDPQQLGPIIRSSPALDYGLDASLMERLIELRHPDGITADSNGTNGVYQLLENYRAHPEILKLYSDIFYQGRLVPRAPAEIANAMLEWPGLVKHGLPVMFKHVDGEEARDLDSPSWYNMAELDAVINIVEDIIKNGHAQPDDIGVIAPYRKQCEKLRQRFHAITQRTGIPFSRIRVGTTEVFQGQEKKIIVLSTVRSRRENLTHDLKFRLGFVANPKRLNVAISRARSLLVVIGNAQLLSIDPNWKQLIHKIASAGGYAGPPLTSDHPSNEGSEHDVDTDG